MIDFQERWEKDAVPLKSNRCDLNYRSFIKLYEINLMFTSNNQYLYIIVYLQSEQFIARNTESVDKDVDMVSISIMIP